MSAGLTVSLTHLVNSHGLVPMRVTDDNFAPYTEGQIAGFPPDEASRLFIRGSAVPVDAKGEVVPVDVPDAIVVEQPVVAPSVDIPDNALELHHLQRIRLAKQIIGDDRNLSAGEADEIILAEIAKRGSHGH